MKVEIIKDWAHSLAPIVTVQGGGKKRIYKKGTTVELPLGDVNAGIESGFVQDPKKASKIEKATSKVNKQTRG